jgi:pimeloyl-ACP methyl ester carboxylesterase
LLAEMTDPGISTPRFDPCAVAVPVVLAAGGESLPHHRETCRRLAHLIPDGRYEEIAGASHIAHITHADRFADLVEGALAVSAPA